MIKYYSPLCILCFVQLLLACSCSRPKEELVGLYELSTINVDGWDRYHNPEFIEFKADNSFALSLVSGDYLGFYELKDNKLKLSSESGGRFNADWEITIHSDRIQLNGLDEGYTVTKMYFHRIETVPSFDEFEEKVIGEWQIYKTREHGQMKRVSNTFMKIDKDGYQIVVDGQIIESGISVVNTRHRKIVFENDDVLWEAWFYGEELRLTNPKNGFQYDLRRID